MPELGDVGPGRVEQHFHRVHQVAADLGEGLLAGRAVDRQFRLAT